MDLPAGLTACKQCGRIEEREQVGSYCQTCIVRSIEDVFVHASDQPDGRKSKTAAIGLNDTLCDIRSRSVLNSRAVTPLSAETGSALLLRKRRALAVGRPSVRIDLRPAQQMQMLSDFLETNFPSTRARAGLADRGSYLSTLPDIEIATTPMLKTAIDTLCFAHIGAKTGDRRLVQRSQTSYGQVLSSLISTMNRRNGDVSIIEPRAVITSIMLLCLYDDSIPLPFQGENGWATHYWGCQQLLGAHGPGFMRIDDPFDRMLFNSLRMPCFFLGVARRKAIAQGKPEWLQLSEDINPGGGPFTGFYRVGMRMPAILEKVDDALEGRLPHTAVKRLCEDIQSLRRETLQWHARLVKTSKDPYWELPKVVDIADLTTASTNEEHLYMRSSSTFTKIFEFGLPKIVVQNHTLCAISAIVMDCSLLRLLHFMPESATCILPDRPQDIEQRAFNQAVNLCRSLYHYASFDGLAYADFSEFINDIALNFFEDYGAASELQWCLAVREATATRRQRIKTNVQPRTLCRMGDAGPGFAKACSYKTPIPRS